MLVLCLPMWRMLCIWPGIVGYPIQALTAEASRSILRLRICLQLENLDAPGHHPPACCTQLRAGQRCAGDPCDRPMRVQDKSGKETNGFKSRMGARGAAPRLLRLKPEDLAHVGSAPLQKGKFTWVTESGREERWIVASCGNYTLLWNFRCADFR